MGGNEAITAWTEVVKSLGFPIFVAVFLLLKGMPFLRDLVKELKGQSLHIAKQTEINRGMESGIEKMTEMQHAMNTTLSGILQEVTRGNRRPVSHLTHGRKGGEATGPVRTIEDATTEELAAEVERRMQAKTRTSDEG